MSEKLEVIQQKPKLFRGFKKALERGRWLQVYIVLCSDCVELYSLSPDQTGIEDGTTLFMDYSEETLGAINAELDARAQFLKDRWLPHYKRLNETAFNGWAIDLTKKDYAVLEVGETVEDLRRFYLSWSFEGVKEAAEYLSRCSNTSLPEEDE